MPQVLALRNATLVIIIIIIIINVIIIIIIIITTMINDYCCYYYCHYYDNDICNYISLSLWTKCSQEIMPQTVSKHREQPAFNMNVDV
jgi:hypothetical protein